MSKYHVLLIFAILAISLEFHSAEAKEKCEDKSKDKSKETYCERTLVPDLKKCSTIEGYSIFSKRESDSKHEVCTKTFTVSRVNLPPYSEHAFKGIMNDILNSCCGDHKTLINGTTFDDLTEVNATAILESDVVFPILGRAAATRLYNYYFIPMIVIPSGYFITGRQTPAELLKRFIGSMGNLWPLLIIMLFLSTLAGFVIWLMEKGINPEQFSPRFRTGLFDGFWWSFVSMTTVGYGDKTPMFIGSRLFSVLWILIGITICSMFTAALTTEFSSLNKPPIPNLEGSDVGILKNRLLDATMVTRGGGAVYESSETALIEGVEDLIRQNKKKIIKGIFLDKFTYMHVKRIFRKRTTHEAEKLNNRSEITKVEFEGEKMAYGILLKSEGDYKFFKEFIKDNQDVFETCKRLEVDGVKMQYHETYLLSPSAGYFWWLLGGNLLIVLLILWFGCVYERREKYRQAKSDNDNIKDSETADSETPFGQ